mmetsp:Transcript_31584/g.51089  ORF Transcript_31584/g.51089 Transcript_31584/m.51089 type:complete len:219 (+) Transcript_31584:1-657(+)
MQLPRPLEEDVVRSKKANITESMNEDKKRGKVHVAVALDESQYGADIVRWSAANIFPNAKKITLIHSYGYAPLKMFPGANSFRNERMSGINTLLKKEAVEKGEAFLKRMGSLTRSLGYKPDELKLLCDVPAVSSKVSILNYTENAKPDMLICGSRGMGAMGRAFLGSTSDYLMHNCKCTIIVVKQKESEKIVATNNKPNLQKSLQKSSQSSSSSSSSS